MANSLLNMITNHFHIVPSILSMLAVTIFFFFGRVTFYGDPFDEKMFEFCLFYMIWQSLVFLVFHLMTMKIGFMYTDLKVVNAGNE